MPDEEVIISVEASTPGAIVDDDDDDDLPLTVTALNDTALKSHIKTVIEESSIMATDVGLVSLLKSNARLLAYRSGVTKQSTIDALFARADFYWNTAERKMKDKLYMPHLLCGSENAKVSITSDLKRAWLYENASRMVTRGVSLSEMQEPEEKTYMKSYYNLAIQTLGLSTEFNNYIATTGLSHKKTLQDERELASRYVKVQGFDYTDSDAQLAWPNPFERKEIRERSRRLLSRASSIRSLQ